MDENGMTFEEMQESTTLIAALFATAVGQFKDEGFLQAKLLQATFSILEEQEYLNPKVKVAVSYMDTVLRNEKAADHCE